jgi:tyrosyl-tRNA synthetase
MKSVSEQIELIRRGTEQIEPADGLQKKLEKSLKTGKPLRVKYGIDPTGIDVHLGHTVPLRKLRQFQELGHHAVLIIGDYTALIGDPSGRDETRARLTAEQVEVNGADYLKQIGRIIDLDKAEVRKNSEWFGRFTFLDTTALAGRTTIQRLLERDDFAKRFRARPESIPIYLHECLYPLMQGHDSVAIYADVELGGSEQLFNLMMGRRLQDAAGQDPQICLTMPILRGLCGVKKMGKSTGNYIGVGMSADVQFAKTMSLPDEPMKEWFTLLTERPAAEIAALTDPARTHPMEAKKTLGRDIVAFYHGANAAAQAASDWAKQHSQGHDPANIPEVQFAAADAPGRTIGILDLLVKLKFCVSKNEARNRVSEGAVTIGPDRVKVTDPKATIPLEDGLIVRLGAKKIARIRLSADDVR